MQYWELETQQSAPLHTVDTASGPYSEAAPPAGLNSTTGQTNQNQEITYVKTSDDSNAYILTGVEGGPYTLINQFDSLKIKSDGTSWWRVQ